MPQATASMGPIEPRRLALKFIPPTLVIEYQRLVDHKRKLYHHRVHLRNLEPDTDIVRIAQKLRRTYPEFLTPAIKDDQLRRLLQKLRDSTKPADKSHKSGASTEEAKEAKEAKEPKEVGGHMKKPLGRGLSRPSSASEDALGSLLGRKSGSLSAPSGGGKLTSLGGGSSLGKAPPLGGATLGPLPSLSLKTGAKLAPVASPAPAPATGQSSRSDRPSDTSASSTGVPGVDGETDLNKYGNTALKIVKEKMSVNFEANRLRPGDPGYVYDVEEEFSEGEESNDWDDSD